MDIESIYPTIGITITCLSFFYLIIRNKFRDTMELKSEINTIKERVTNLETKVTPFWNWVDRELPKILHSPHTPELDVLLEKYENKYMMSLKDLEHMRNILYKEIKHTNRDKVLLYVLFLISLDVYIKEKKNK